MQRFCGKIVREAGKFQTLAVALPRLGENSTVMPCGRETTAT